jgi:hypothetical protein
MKDQDILSPTDVANFPRAMKKDARVVTCRYLLICLLTVLSNNTMTSPAVAGHLPRVHRLQRGPMLP